MLLINSGAHWSSFSLHRSVFVSVSVCKPLSSIAEFRLYKGLQLCFKAQHGQNSLVFVINAN